MRLCSTPLCAATVAVALLLVIAGKADAGAPPCLGDCDDSGSVSIDEVIRGVRLALGSGSDGCLPRFDDDSNGRADVDELLAGVENLLGGCVQTPGALRFRFDFADGALGWTAGFSDYPPGEEENFELEEGIRPLPVELGTSATGFFLSGNNHSDDLFMFLKRRLGTDDGIVPGRSYSVSFDVRFASNAPSDCFGVGGAPGESVHLKVGGSASEPLPVPGNEGLLVMNIDKGNQGEGGADASVAGNVANGLPCEEAVPYVSIQRGHTHPTPVTASETGELWLIIGTDSGFEATTAPYYQLIEVRLSTTPVPRSID